jgi:hypothetical protein
MAEFLAHRAAVKQELDDLLIDNFAFEHNGASDRDPEKIFLEAIRGKNMKRLAKRGSLVTYMYSVSRMSNAAWS